MCFTYFCFIRFFYTGQVPKGVEVAQAAADPSKVLKNTGEMNKDILHDNLTLFLELSDFYHVAELKDIVEDAMIERLDDENYEEFLVEAKRYGGERLKTAVTDFLGRRLAMVLWDLLPFK